MSEPKHIRDILPGVLLEIRRRMCRYSETHPEGSCRGLNAECHIYKEDNRVLQSVCKQGKQRRTDGY